MDYLTINLFEHTMFPFFSNESCNLVIVLSFKPEEFSTVSNICGSKKKKKSEENMVVVFILFKTGYAIFFFKFKITQT